MYDWITEDITMPTYAYVLLVIAILWFLFSDYTKGRKINRLEEDNDRLADDNLHYIEAFEREFELNTSLTFELFNVMLRNSKLSESRAQLMATVEDLTAKQPADVVDDTVTRLSYCTDCAGLRWPDHFQMNPDHIVRRLNTAKPDDN